MIKKLPILLLSGLISISSFAQKEKGFEIPHEKYTLSNGLQVIFHVDRSDPVVAVSITAHVGSAREKIKRTGFAHLFEHLLFLESENLGRDGLDQMSARIGGSGANGFTNRDLTNYLQTVPNDALEKMLWAEADKLGWFINTVTDPVLAKEKEVVKNEKRMRYDNRPYGHTSIVISKNLYPTTHPYNWSVIGSLEDLESTTLADVKEFYKKWYIPNNVTLVVSGDFDVAQTKKWIQKYFEEIPKGNLIANAPKQAITLDKTKSYYHEDNFAQLPELTMVWPTVEWLHDDERALEVLTNYLATGKKAPLNKLLIDEQKLTSRVGMFNWTCELAGQMHLSVRAFKGNDLDDVYKQIQVALATFEKEGIAQKDLDRIKTKLEAQFYDGLSSVLDKGSALAQYNTIAGDPSLATKEMDQLMAVTTEDVIRVYNKYIKGKYFVSTSFVPKGKIELALDGALKADIVEEKIVSGAEKQFDATTATAPYTRTKSSFDRTIEPKYGAVPSMKTPPVWEHKLENGLKIYGITSNEVPVVDFNITIDGGQLLETKEKLGVANLLTDMMIKGTKTKTPQELEEAMENLGANIYVYASGESIVVGGKTLSRNYDKTMAIVYEMITAPRWDQSEFDLIKQRALSQIEEDKGDPGAISENTALKLLYGEDNILAYDIKGSKESVTSITMDDLKTYHSKYLSPVVAKLLVVGDVSKAGALSSATKFNSWKSKLVAIPKVAMPARPEKAQVYFYDVTGAKQSIINVGYPCMTAQHPDYYKGAIMNYKLGGGGFASILTQELRNKKGYTYTVRSRFNGSKNVGNFSISTGVRSNVTYESLALIKEILETYGKNFGEDELATTKSFLIKSNARAFETASAKLNLLSNISNYDWSYDYVKQREATVNSMDVAGIKALAEQFLDPNKMIWLVTGDAKTQLGRIKELGLGEPILLNK